MSDPFTHAKTILKILEENGFKAYIVGGSVRDYLLKRPIHDIDIATSATPEQVMTIFPVTFPVGVKHGTVIVRHENCNYEVTTFRSESGYKDFRHPDEVTFETSIFVDLARRDFTMNAMAMAMNGQILDPYGGRADLKKGILRTVGNAEARFKEDPLRQLRAIRFIAQLSLKPDRVMEKAITTCAPYIRHLAVERIREEMTKLLMQDAAPRGLELLLRTGLHTHLPGSQWLPRLECTLDVSFRWLDTEDERWALFLISSDCKNPDAFLKTWKFSNKTALAILSLMNAFQRRNQYEWDKLTLYQYGLETACSVEKIRRAMGHAFTSQEILTECWVELPIKSRSQLAVNGRDLCRWLDKKGGPWTGRLLEHIENKVILGEVSNDRHAIQRWLERHAFD
ncbi:CCA tRNA nucleotidyltransferase [Tuberibacillus calidus]|jgi:tRNA nucleotidyltransferase (CCA-adding enzyme)|uniref:CCA tRNA nucleotidyltransferase n=1 Tax=Tuberibacillus calidus TaxID=340097 RepID=UPI0003FED56E|nr:CCA tRNA nucleotidyltransferase [Tuberibacillus calidus]